MLGELILRITAQVDNVLAGLNKTKAEFSSVSAAIQNEAKAIDARYAATIGNVQGRIEAFRKSLKSRGFFDQAGIASDKAEIAKLEKILQQAEQAIKRAGAQAKIMQNEVSTALRLAEVQTRTSLQNVVNVGSMMRQFGAALRTSGIVATLAVAAIAAAGADLVSTGAEFEQTMDTVVSVVAEFQAAGGRASDTFVELEGVIRKLGETTNFTASQVSTAARALGQAGLSGSEIVAALPGTVNLARAGFLELGRAAEIAADFMNAFQMEGREVATVADAMAAAAANSNTTIEQLGNAFSFAAPIAAALGQSVEGTAAALAVLANSGIKSSRAGTGLAQIMSALIRKTSDTEKMMRKYGSSFEAVNPEVKSHIEILEEFKRVGVSSADVMSFFGERAGRAMIALQNAPTDEIRDLAETIENSFGEALRQATERWTNLAGSIKGFVSVVESIKLTIFEAIKDDLIFLVNGITDSLRTFSEMLREGPLAEVLRPLMLLVTGLTALLGIAAAVTVAVGTLLSAWGGASAAVASMGISVMASNVALEAAAEAAGKAAIEANALAASVGRTSSSYNALAAAAAKANAAAAAANANAAAGSAVAAGNTSGTLSALIGSQASAAAATLAAGLAKIVSYTPHILILTTSVAALLAAFEFDDANFERYESLKGLLITISDVLQTSFKEGMDYVKKSFEWLGSFLPGVNSGLGQFVQWLGFDPNSSAWDGLVAAVRELLGSLSVLVQAALPPLTIALTYLAGLVGGTLVAAWKVFLFALTGAVKLLGAVVDGVVWAITVYKEWIGDIDHAKDAASALEQQYDKLNEKLKDNTAQVEAQVEAMRKKSVEFDKDAKNLSKMASLLARKEELSIAELNTLSDLIAEYGEYEDVKDRLLKQYKAEEAALMELLEQTNLSTQAQALAEQQLELVRHKMESVEDTVESLIESEAKWGSEVVRNTDAIDAQRAKAEDSARVLAERAEILDAAADAEKRFSKIVEEAAEARISAYDQEIKKLAEKQQAVQADAAAMIAAKNRLAQDAQAQIDELNKQIDDPTPKPGQTAEGKQLADDRRRDQIAELRQRKAERLAEAAQIQADQQATVQALAQLEADARDRQTRKQQEYLRDQNIAQLKMSGDKIAIAQAEADKFLAIERRKIADTFIMQDAATQQQKQLALRQAQDLANAKVEEARREVAEDEKKKREAEAKEKQKSLKDLKKDELSIEEKILEAGAKKLENMNQLIQLTMFLHKLQRAREIRAANAVRDVFATREKIAKLEEAVNKNPNNANMQRGLEEAKSKLVFEEAFAGKKLNEAGISDITRQAFKDLSTGIHAALESSEVTLSVISTTLVDSLQVQRDILAAISQKLGWSPQPAAQGAAPPFGGSGGGLSSAPSGQVPPTPAAGSAPTPGAEGGPPPVPAPTSEANAQELALIAAEAAYVAASKVSEHWEEEYEKTDYGSPEHAAAEAAWDAAFDKEAEVLRALEDAVAAFVDAGGSTARAAELMTYREITEDDVDYAVYASKERKNVNQPSNETPAPEVNAQELAMIAAEAAYVAAAKLTDDLEQKYEDAEYGSPEEAAAEAEWDAAFDREMEVLDTLEDAVAAFVNAGGSAARAAELMTFREVTEDDVEDLVFTSNAIKGVNQPSDETPAPEVNAQELALIAAEAAYAAAAQVREDLEQKYEEADYGSPKEAAAEAAAREAFDREMEVLRALEDAVAAFVNAGGSTARAAELITYQEVTEDDVEVAVRKSNDRKGVNQPSDETPAPAPSTPTSAPTPKQSSSFEVDVPDDVTKVFGDGPPDTNSGEMFAPPSDVFGAKPSDELTRPVMAGDPDAITPERMAEIRANQEARKAEYRRKSEEARAQAKLSRIKRVADAPWTGLPSDTMPDFHGQSPDTEVEMPKASTPVLDTRGRGDEMFGKPPGAEVNPAVPDQEPMKWKEGTPFFTSASTETVPDIAKAILEGFSMLKSANPVAGVARLSPTAGPVQALAPGSAGGGGATTLTDNRVVTLNVENNVDEARMEQTVRRVLTESGFNAIG